MIPTSGWMPIPLAELTIAEAALAERRVLDEGNDGVVLVSAGHLFEVLAEPT